MDEYIKRESAIEAIMSDPPDAHYQSWYAEKINEIPSADVEPLVRCRGCKYWQDNIIDYVVIGKEYTNFFGDGRCPMHICNYCWDEMKKRVKYNLPEKKKE